MSEPWTPGPWKVQDGWTLTAEEGRFVSGEELAANLRLAALAPEMAEFARGVAGMQERCCGMAFDPQWCMHDRARSLLARARGEA